MLVVAEHYIDGRWEKAANDQELLLKNPSTGTKQIVVRLGSKGDIDRAVTCAKSSFSVWSDTSKEYRHRFLQKILQNYDQRADDLAHAISNEVGCPIDFSLSSQVVAGRAQIQSSLEELERFEFEELLDRLDGNHLLYEPIGVCGLITPWNWPMNQIALKVLPALAAGNTVVLKPSELAPVSAKIFAEIIHEARLPKGVFNMIQGDGPTAGQGLAKHPDVAMISFTGSKRAGAQISRTAADTVKRVTLELGGKGANIVFPDAGTEAVERGVQHCFRNSGQSCNAPTRMLVERSFYEQAVEAAVNVANNTGIELASEPGSHIGPVISQSHYERVQSFIALGMREGATLAAGGLGRPEGLDQGYFVKPTVFSDVHPSMTIANEEIFGPVLSIMPFGTECEAIQIANETSYGLVNYIQTLDLSRASRIARAVRSGVVEINGKSRSVGTPFGGFKQSGNGREGGKWGLEDFLEIKVISL